MEPVIKRLTTWLLAALLAGCAAAPPVAPTAPLLHDEFFAPPAERPDPEALFVLSDEMKRYAAAELRSSPLRHDPRRALIDALYSRGELGLKYDASVTRNAMQAFEARAGNCLSLVIMTAAFAKHLGLPVRYRSVLVEEMYTRQGDLTMASGHVNLVLDRLPQNLHSGPMEPGALMVDFLPPEELRGQRSVTVNERTIVAMFMNNRAVEMLSQGLVDTSYAWAREAVRQDPSFGAAINTLGVIYLRAGHHIEAEAVFRALLTQEPDHVSALTNLVRLLQRDGRPSEAQALGEQLARLQPQPPFHFYDLGRQAMARREFKSARDLFRRELRRQPYQHEVHFWAAQAAAQLGDTAGAVRHLRQAMENSPDSGSHDAYAGKLAHLRASRLQ